MPIRLIVGLGNPGPEYEQTRHNAGFWLVDNLANGIGRCKLWLDGEVLAVAPRPMRPFQGWRYYQPKDAPPDLDESQPGFAEMPEGLRRELAALGLL